MADPQPQKPLELILARNLLTSISTPAFLVDGDAAVVFYNEAAAALLGTLVRGCRTDERRGVDARLRPLRPRRRTGRGRRRWRPPTRSATAAPPTAVQIRTADGNRAAIEASAFPIVAAGHGSVRRDDLLLARPPRTEPPPDAVKVWGARGSVPSPGPHMNRYGGNTSCVQVTLASGEELILDAGTGIRTLGLGLTGQERIHILLTHLHLDHIQGLMFFPPCFRAESEITIWGPASPEASLEDAHRPLHLGPALARSRCVSCPARSPFATRLASRVGARRRRRSAPRRSPTAGRRSAIGSPTATPRSPTSPTTSRALGASLDELEPEWISGFDLARDVDLLIHDCQYTDDEYPAHVGWGHSGVSDDAHLRGAGSAQSACCSSTTTRCTPTSSSTSCSASARRRWQELGGDADRDRAWAWRAPSSMIDAGCPDCPRLSSR